MNAFEEWGRFVFRHRRTVLACSVATVLVSGVGISMGGHLQEHQSLPIEASAADDLIHNQLPAGPPRTHFLLLFHSGTLIATDGSFQRAMSQALQPLRHNSLVQSVTTPSTSPPVNGWLISTDRHSAVADVEINQDSDHAAAYYPELRALVRSSVLTVDAAGGLPLEHDYNRLLNEGLAKSGMVALPLTLILLLLVFGSVMAATLPLAVGVFTIVGATAAAFLISRIANVSPSVTEFISFLGLGLAIDYSLFIVSRFRENLASKQTVEGALAACMATTGRAIFFSGLTVMAGLSGLFFYSGTWMAEVAAPLVIVVAFTLFYALTLLPASLAVLGRRVDALRIPRHHGQAPGRFWRALSTRVMRRPLRVLVPTLAVVALAASPMMSLQLATDHGSSLPASAESRRGSTAVLTAFPQLSQTGMDVVVRFAQGQPLTAAHVAELYDLGRRIAGVPRVVAVDGVVFAALNLDRSGVIQLLSGPRSSWPPAVTRAAHDTVGRDIAVLTVNTSEQPQSQGAREVVEAIRRLGATVPDQVMATGSAAYDLDATAWILGRTPLALGFVFAVTFLILLCLVGSVLLPVKAVLANLLSISVAFGAMVWMFQQGHLSSVLGFTPGPIDPTVPVVMFCIVFGLSMDYEVFLLCRIQEEFRRTGDNARAVAGGLARCGRLVTFAAAIMVTVFASFALGDVTVIKAVGLGTAIAVAVDATVTRGVIVPAAMVLMGRANWWAPAWLHSTAERLSRKEVVDELAPDSGAAA